MIKSEDKRLQTVKKFNGLKIDREKELQDIVKLSAEICNTPVALITLMDKNIQHNVWNEGTDITENTKVNSFCKYLLTEKDIVEVDDALNDYRFNTNQIPLNTPSLRFYAGVPLTTPDEQHVGTLCVFDIKPKKLTETQKQSLLILSRQVMNLMALEINTFLLENYLTLVNLKQKEIEFAEFKLQSFFESSTICHFLVGQHLEVLFFNKMAAKKIARLHNKEIVCGRKLTEFISKDLKTIVDQNFERTLAGDTFKGECLLNYPNADPIWWDIEFTPARDATGKIVGVSINTIDITENKNQTEKILVQNAALKKVAQMQSHQFRPTVANIIGLINILKEENLWKNNEYFYLLEQSINELDKKTRAVVEYAVLIPRL